MMRGSENHRQQQHPPLYELCALLLAVLRSPEESIAIRRSPLAGRRWRVSPAGFASLLIGVALALTLCGWITFMVGFILVPWLLGLAMMLYFVAAVSSISDLGRALLFPNRPPVFSSFTALPPLIPRKSHCVRTGEAIREANRRRRHKMLL